MEQQNQNQQPNQRQPNYDFITNQGQKQPSQPGQSGKPVPKKTRFKISKPLLFGGIGITIILIVLTIIAVTSKPANTTSASTQLVEAFIQDILVENTDQAFNKLSSKYEIDRDKFKTDFVERTNSLLYVNSCEVSQTVPTSPISDLVTVQCDSQTGKYILDVEVVDEEGVRKINAFSYGVSNE